MSSSSSSASAVSKDSANTLRVINEEYKIWRKHTPFLYDVVMTHALEWPSLTVQWLPDMIEEPGKDYSKQRVLIGTHTSDNEMNNLIIAEVRLPLQETPIDPRQYNNNDGESGGFGAVAGKVEIIQQICHQGEIHKARYMPQNPDIIATKSPFPDVCVYDRTKHPTKPEKAVVATPDITLKGHSKEGFGLSWNGLKEGHLVSGSADNLCVVWDINATAKDRSLDPLRVYKGHHAGVNDVSWNYTHEHMFASASDDKTVLVWDTRSADTKSAAKTISGHKDAVNCVQFSPHSEFLFIAGCADGSVLLYDLRDTSKKLHSFETHQNSILSVAWAPFSESIFATSSQDRRVNVWDISRIGQELSHEETQDGPPELLFVHGGHTDNVADISWNMNDDWVMASVADDNILQIWQMAESIYLSDDEEEGDEVEEIAEKKE
jgi:WD40 repeat protein